MAPSPATTFGQASVAERRDCAPACTATGVMLAMKTVQQYREFAQESRKLAAKLTDPNDKRGMELMAKGWDKVADDREASIAAKLVMIPPQTLK